MSDRWLQQWRRCRYDPCSVHRIVMQLRTVSSNIWCACSCSLTDFVMPSALFATKAELIFHSRCGSRDTLGHAFPRVILATVPRSTQREMNQSQRSPLRSLRAQRSFDGARKKKKTLQQPSENTFRNQSSEMSGAQHVCGFQQHCDLLGSNRSNTKP